MKSLRTARLQLETLTRAHAEEMFPVLGDVSIYTFLDYGPPASVDALRKLYARLEAGHSPDRREIWLNWLVRLQDGPAIGYVQATVHPGRDTYLGYVLAPGHWGRGYAGEALTALIAHLAHRHPTPVTLAVVEAANLRSAAVLRRLGFGPASPAEASVVDLAPSERLYLLRPATSAGCGTA